MSPRPPAAIKTCRRHNRRLDAAGGMMRDIQLWVPFATYAVALCFLMAVALGLL